MIGTGAIAPVHAKGIESTPGARLAYVKNRSRERAQAFADEHGAEVLDDVDRLIDASDAVIITCPGYAHVGYALTALKAGKPVLCEKPGAVSVEEAERLVEAVDRGGIYQLGLNRRFAPVYRRVRELILDGELGPTSYNARINRGELTEPAWVSDPKVSGGYAYETLIHLIDLLRHLFGDVSDLTARISRKVYGEPDNLTILFEHQGGVHGALTSCAHATWTPPFERVEVFGRDATVCTEELDRLTSRIGLEEETREEDFSELPEAERWGFHTQMKSFLARVRGGAPDPRSAGAGDVLAAARLIEKIYEERP